MTAQYVERLNTVGIRPLLRGGVAGALQRNVSLPQTGAAGEVRNLLQQWFDLPGRAEFEGASYYLIGAATLLEAGGRVPSCRSRPFVHSFIERRYSALLLLLSSCCNLDRAGSAAIAGFQFLRRS